MLGSGPDIDRRLRRRSIPGIREVQHRDRGAPAALREAEHAPRGDARTTPAPLHVPAPGGRPEAARRGVRSGVPLPRPVRAHPAGRSRGGAPHLRELRRPPHLPPRRGLGKRQRARPVSRVLFRDLAIAATVIHLRRRSPAASSGLPEDPGDAPVTAAEAVIAPSYSALHRVELARFTRRPGGPGSRLVSVALVLASRRTGVTRYPASRSSDFPRVDNGFPRWDTRPSDHLAGSPILPPAGRPAQPEPNSRSVWAVAQPTFTVLTFACAVPVWSPMARSKHRMHRTP